jgi:hypothetical protein
VIPGLYKGSSIKQAQRVATSQTDTARRYLLSECVEAYLLLEGPHLDEYEKLLRTEDYGMALKVGKTSFEKGQLHMVFLMLQKRFGPLSEAVRQRIETLSNAQFEALTDALLTAASLRELGLEEGETSSSS